MISFEEIASLLGTPFLDTASEVTYHDPALGFVLAGSVPETIIHEAAHIAVYPRTRWQSLEPTSLDFDGDPRTDPWDNILEIEAPVLACVHDILSGDPYRDGFETIVREAGRLAHQYLGGDPFGEFVFHRDELVAAALSMTGRHTPASVRAAMLLMDVYLMRWPRKIPPDDIFHIRLDPIVPLFDYPVDAVWTFFLEDRLCALHQSADVPGAPEPARKCDPYWLECQEAAKYWLPRPCAWW